VELDAADASAAIVCNATAAMCSSFHSCSKKLTHQLTPWLDYTPPCTISILSILLNVQQCVAALHVSGASAAKAPAVTLQASITDDHKQAAPGGVASQSVVRSNSNLQQQQHLEPAVDSSGPGSSGYDVADAEQQQQQQQCTSAQQQAHITAAAQQFIEDATASTAAGDAAAACSHSS
jgi:hypothetical protein